MNSNYYIPTQSFIAVKKSPSPANNDATPSIARGMPSISFIVPM